MLTSMVFFRYSPTSVPSSHPSLFYSSCYNFIVPLDNWSNRIWALHDHWRRARLIYLLIPVVLFSFDSFKLNLLIEYFVSAPPFRHWNTKRARFLYKLVLPCEYQTTIVILLTIQLCPIRRPFYYSTARCCKVDTPRFGRE